MGAMAAIAMYGTLAADGNPLGQLWQGFWQALPPRWDFIAAQVLWALAFLAALALGIRYARWHHHRGKVKVGGQLVGEKVATDVAGATMFRSAESVRKRPHLSPLHGKPGWVRVLLFPAPVVLAYGWTYYRIVTAAVLALTAVWAGVRVYWWARAFRHNSTLVKPLAEALAPVTEQDTDDVLEGLVVPRDYQDEQARVYVPLPNHHRVEHANQAHRLVAARLGGEWNHKISPRAPYLLTFSHRPAPPSLVTYEDVAEMIVHRGGMWTPLLGLGAEQEANRLNFNGDVVHLGISAGTGAGKSTVMRLLATQFAINGVTQQLGIDVKGDSFEGCEHIPGMHIHNDYKQISSMWTAIHNMRLECDARREGKRGPKEGWDPIIIYLEEQNMFSRFTSQAWAELKDKEDPKVCPVWNDIEFLMFMGRSFNVRLVAAYQKMTTASIGGGDAARGGEIRSQFGNRLLARFDSSAWDMLVGTRPRGQSSDIPGRWLLVPNSGTARQVQIPMFEPESSADALRQADLPVSPALFPGVSPDALDGPTEETTDALGDMGDTGDTGELEDGSQRPALHLVTWEPDTENATEERRYTLEEACEEGVIPVSYDTAKKRRTRANYAMGPALPEGEKDGRTTTYTAEELTEWHEAFERQKKAT